MSDIVAVEYAKISASNILIYKYLENYTRKRNKTSFTTEKNKKGKVQGSLSDAAKKRIKKIVTIWISAVLFYYKSKNYNLDKIAKQVKFITLTLPSDQAHDDKFLKRELLQLFIKNLKNKYGLKNYLWINETQKNGNLHFHIITDIYVKNTAIQKIWNKILDKHGYIDKFEKKHGHRNPPTTDIHTIKKINNIVAYLSKEATKGQQSRKIEGKMWSCNKELLELDYYEILFDANLGNFLHNFVNKKPTRQLKDNFFELIFFEAFDFFEFMDFRKSNDLINYYKDVMQHLFKTK